MNLLESQLKSILLGRVCILGVGNRLKGDDAAGPLLIDRIKDKIDAACIDAGVAPENYLDVALRDKPDVVVIIDAADFGGAPGEARVFSADAVAEAGVSTHASSLGIVADYIKARAGAAVSLVAVQPARTSMNQPLSPEVAVTVEQIAEAFAKLMPRV